MWKRLYIISLCFVLALCNQSENQVWTNYGPVNGILTPTTREFYGIPYAKPPVGSLRWRPPQRPTPWTTPLDASNFGPSCSQEVLPILNQPGITTFSENCLFLNIYTPRTESLIPLPVLFWIHGGAFIVGGAATYNATSFASNFEVIVVTINYRLGAMGFLALEGLISESGTTGTYGILDQQMALTWVQENIWHFGGDPRRVTIFGESAGGTSVDVLLTSYLSVGLFSGAILESAAPRLVQTLGEGVNRSLALAAGVSCSPQLSDRLLVSCLRNISADIITGVSFLQITNALDTWSPVVDGYLITKPPIQLLKEGNFNHVPVISGANHNEGTAFVYALLGNSFSEAQYEDFVNAYWAGHGSEVLALYPASNYPSPFWALSAALGDFLFKCPSRRTAELVSAFAPTYLYQFVHNSTNYLWNFLGVDLGSFHGAEVPFVFHEPNIYPFTPQENTFSLTMQKYWCNFAANRTPGTSSGFTWPLYFGDVNIVLDLQLSLQTALGTPRQCNYWDATYY